MRTFGVSRQSVVTPMTPRYAHAFQLAEACLFGLCDEVSYARRRVRARQLRLEGRGGDIDDGGFAPLP
ncbi:hypothetical protein [Phenylobacterium sp. LjRoot225]|uniref:hypothetical protein n=1 Tax=Phenylobacterium sp. LjRoot225 TaxID=3342285 RepID=UPI003F506A86